jgi:hypothetical protein
MGIALRSLKGDQNVGEGPIEVKVRFADFDILEFPAQGGQVARVPASPLIGFSAMAFREVEPDSDLWEFRVPHPEGGAKNVYLHGGDILLVRATSKVL